MRVQNIQAVIINYTLVLCNSQNLQETFKTDHKKGDISSLTSEEA